MLKKILLMIVLLSGIASAATIHGSIYDFTLDLKPDTKIHIDTRPEQLLVSKDGTYSFDVPVGKYTITAEYVSGGETVAKTSEEINIEKDGVYRRDLILFDIFEEPSLQTDSDFDTMIDLDNEYSPVWPYILAFILLLSIFGTYMLYLRRRNLQNLDILEEEKDDELLDKVISIIKEQGGRTTQKYIRKKLPFSEAKVSLLITELEDKNLIRKIKKGRSNIIILNKS